MELRSLFDSLLQEPSLDKFLQLRKSLLDSKYYDPYSTEIQDMQTCVRAGDAQDIIDVFKGTYPNLLISPTAHFILGAAYERLGNRQMAEYEKWAGILILQCIVETGDGTREHPYLIARFSDEFDVLNSLGKETGTRGLLCENSRLIDIQRCSDGTDVCFDVTDAYLSWREKSSIPQGEEMC